MKQQKASEKNLTANGPKDQNEKQDKFQKQNGKLVPVDKKSESAAPYGSVVNDANSDPYGAQSLQSQPIQKSAVKTIEVKIAQNSKFNSELGPQNNLVLPAIGSQSSISASGQAPQNALMKSKLATGNMSIAENELIGKPQKKRQDYTNQTGIKTVRLKKDLKELSSMKSKNHFKNQTRQNGFKQGKDQNIATMEQIQEEFLNNDVTLKTIEKKKMASKIRNARTDMDVTRDSGRPRETKSTRDLSEPSNMSPINIRRGIFTENSEIDFVVNRQHNASSVIGPGSYDLPLIQNGKGFIGQIKNAPSISFGANMKVAKKAYHHECYKDFIGIDSPGLNKYSPNINSVKNVQPKFSMSRAERFQLPKSLVKIQSQLPAQYATLDFKQNGPLSSHKLYDKGAPNLMGLGPRFEFGKSEKRQNVPGPQYHENEHSISMKYKVDHSPNNNFGNRLAFGSTKSQNDKLQYHGQGKHFYGRENKLGPGGYDPDFSKYTNNQNGSISGLAITNNVVLSRNDRGLLPDKAIDERKHQTYNQSHAQVGPASYGANNGKYETSTDIYNKTSGVKQGRSQKMNKTKRQIDLTRWRAENMVLIEKGLGNKPPTDHNNNVVNGGKRKCLPPGVASNATFGNCFVEMGELKWLTYDGVNYLEDYGKGPKIQDLYANIKFWGEDPASKGIYLKCSNGMKPKKETAANKYRYGVNTPEPSFERYIDDMGALVVDFYSVQEGLTIGTSKIIVKLYIKRHKQPGDMAPMIELRGTFPITLIGNNDAKIGEFSMAITSSFTNKSSPIPELNNQLNMNNRDQIDLNEDTFESNEQLARNMAMQDENNRLHSQMNQDNRIPSSLQGKGANQDSYQSNQFNQIQQERPTRDKPQTKIQNSKLTGKNADLNFESRQQINLDEETFQNQGELEGILARGERLRKQMADAIEPANQAWEELHGIHNVPKTYVPPFMDNKKDDISSPEKLKDQMYDIEVDHQALNPFDTQFEKSAPPKNPDYDQQQNCEEIPDDQAGKRQIKDMKFIRIKVKQLKIESNQTLISKLIDESFNLQINIPLPDPYQKKISVQQVHLNNYEVESFNEFAFNSLSMYNFRIDEQTLSQYASSQMTFLIPEHKIEGSLNLNKLIMAHDFKIEETVDLVQGVTKVVKDDNQKKSKQTEQTQFQYVGTLKIEINLQSGDSEDEVRRNYQIKMQKVEEENARLEADRIEMNRKKMQFVMEQAPVFGQIYMHIIQLGHNDNIGERSQDQVLAAENAAAEEAKNDPANILIQAQNLDTGGFTSSLNQRATGTDEFKPSSGTDLEREKAAELKKTLKLPKRNLYVQFKAFPGLECLKTNTAWQQNDDAVFNYRSQFPVLMSPDTLDKMESFIFVLELWDQISPSVQEFIGLVKIPLAPICYSMKTTDQEVYSLNFMADQFCLYPMIVSDGYLPIYSPKLGQDVGHIKVTLAMGSPVQVNRLIQKEQAEEKRIQNDIDEKRIREAEMRKEKEIKDAKRAKKEKKRQLEEERKKKDAEENEGMDMFSMGGKMTKTQMRQMKMSPGKMLRTSMNSDTKPDYDQRSQTMLNCMRKLFEEARGQNIEELNGESLFKDEAKNFDGSVQKDEVMYAFLNNQSFSLTRIELSQILSLMMDINRDDQGKIDIDELHFSFRSYIKYYELIEQRIIDMLEKFKISIVKKLELQDIILEVVAEIEKKAEDSKMPGIQLREILEDRHGVQIRDALYDQFSLFFDLDRDQQVYVTSLCEYLKMPSSQKINFFKVNPTVITTQIAEYIKNAIETQTDCMPKLEEEFKQEIWKIARPKKDGQEFERELDVIPADLLLSEKINAKLFQYRMKRMGIALSLWEVFTFFEFLNTKNAKMFFEPQRYHHVMFGTFFTFVQNEEYNRSAANKNRGRSKESKKKERPKSKKRDNSQQEYDLQKNGYRFGQNDGHSEEEEEDEVRVDDKGAGYWHRNDHSDTEDPRKPYKQIKHIFEIKVKELKNIPVLNKFICQTQTQAENNINQVSSLSHDPRFQKIARAQANKYIQNVAVKYSFPLDEDEILESDYLQLNKDALDQQGIYNYNVSMDTVHTYIIGKEDKIKRVLELCQSRGGNQNASGLGDPYDDGNMMNANQARREELFNMSIALYQDNREYIIGNSHLPIEDLIDVILQFEQKNGTYNPRTKKSSLNRTLFLYGTTYSQRENCIIGKLQLELQYTQEKIYLSKREAAVYKEELANKTDDPVLELSTNPYSCFMHRETYINRKIPLNAKLSVLIDRVSNLKESIENIEHFSKIQHSALGIDFAEDQEGFEYENLMSQKLSSSSMVHNRKNLQHMDRRRVLKHILKNGLNLIVKCSVFEEDQDLVKKFDVKGGDDQMQPSFDNGAQAKLLKNYAKYQTRMLYNSLNPVFGEVFEMNLQMDTKIFEYLKNKRAVFEIRHYIIESQKQKLNKIRESHSRMAGEDFNQRDLENESQQTIEDQNVQEECDYIVLGYVRVPLLQLITKNNGVDGDFSIFDEFKQKMGSLKMRITLNHHNSQRPLYSTSSKLPNQVQNPITPNNANQKKTLIDKSININSQVSMGTITKAQMSHSKFILGLDFIELILKERRELVAHVQGQTQRFFLKYRLFNENFQTKFIGGDDRQSLSALNVLLQKVKLQKFDINKTTFVELDMFDQTQIEQAFGKPVEIQLWHKIESLKSYEKPIKEEMIGQFFIELNELSKVTNRRLKEHQVEAQPGKFQVFEGYFSMHECKRDILSSDRLGMRLFLFNKDDTNEMLTVDDLNQIFNLYRKSIEENIANKLDQSGRGYSDMDDLVQIVKDHIQDEYLAQKLIWFIKTSLEFKNVDKVYYSPLFGLPPPFFKYSDKFDQLEIICKLNEELESLDSTDNGFIPVNLFRNALEDELKIKTKIVDDFINSIRDLNIENSNVQSNTATVKEMQSLDVNLITNSLKTSHIDYIILLRKLSQFMDQNSGNNDAKSYVHRRIVDNMQAHETAQDVSIYFEIDNGMRVKNPLDSNEKPNSFVYMKPSFKYKEDGQFVQTNQIKSNSYPNWNFKSQNFTMPLNSFNKEWLENGGILEFEVFHKAVGASNNLNVQESSHLIGAAFVPLKPFIDGSGKTRITGLYDVVAKSNIYNQSVQSMSSLKAQESSQGKIKICITSNLNIRKLLNGGQKVSDPEMPVASFITQHLGTASLKNSVSAVSEASVATGMRNISFGAEYAYNAYPTQKYSQQSPQKSTTQAPSGQHLQMDGLLNSQNFQKHDQDARAYHQTLQTVSGQHLDELHKLNMNSLDELTKKLKDSMTVLDTTEPDTAFVNPSDGGFGLATFKTDTQQATMTRDLNQFREQHLKAPKAALTNPFASIDAPSLTKELKRVEKDDGFDDLARGDDASQGTSDQQLKRNVGYEMQPPMDLAEKSDSLASGRFGDQAVEESLNVFEEKKEADLDELNYDEDEMAEMMRIDKIFKQQ